MNKLLSLVICGLLTLASMTLTTQDVIARSNHQGKNVSIQARINRTLHAWTREARLIQRSFEHNYYSGMANSTAATTISGINGI